MHRPGNPHGAPRVPLYKVTFKLDQETYDALRGLEASFGPNIRGRRSSVLRSAILEKYRRSGIE